MGRVIVYSETQEDMGLSSLHILYGNSGHQKSNEFRKSFLPQWFRAMWHLLVLVHVKRT